MADDDTSPTTRPLAAGPHPKPSPRPRPKPTDAENATEETRVFSQADLDALAVLIRGDSRTQRRPPARRPPNVGTGAVVVLVVFLVALAAVAALTLWLVLR